MDIYADWTTAQLFKLDEKAAERLSMKLAKSDAWLVACISELSKDTDRLLSVLDLARETMAHRHYALLPVQCETADWKLLAADSPYHLPSAAGSAWPTPRRSRATERLR